LFYKIKEPVQHVSPPMPFFFECTLGGNTIAENHQFVG